MSVGLLKAASAASMNLTTRTMGQGMMTPYIILLLVDEQTGPARGLLEVLAFLLLAAPHPPRPRGLRPTLGDLVQHLERLLGSDEKSHESAGQGESAHGYFSGPTGVQSMRMPVLSRTR